jgi:CARDB
MNRRITGMVFVVTVTLASACSTVETPQQAHQKASTQDPSRIQVNQPLHFTDPDGNAVVVQPGTYRVEQAADSQLRLISTASSAPIVLSAHAVPSTADVPNPVALGTLHESEIYHLVLLLAGHNALETYGSVSGVQSRGGFGALKGSAFLNAAKLQVQPPPPQPLPDLVPTCGRVFCFGGLFGGTTCTVMTGVLNQGTAAAGPSQAKNGANTQAVTALQPGQLQGLVFGAYSGAPPQTVQADAANQVNESNEQNNTGQLCP